MATSVTSRIKEIKQPRGGYLSPRLFSETKFPVDAAAVSLEGENVSPALVGMAVDYLSRYMCGASVMDAFRISLMGAKKVGEYDIASGLALSICGFDKTESRKLDDYTIATACQLVGYDTAYRAGAHTFRPVEDIRPNAETINHIREMVNRTLQFFDAYGPVIADGMEFEGGYTDTVPKGDADFMTADTLWDMKVSKNKPTAAHTLQLLTYWRLAVHCQQSLYEGITKIGIFNPRSGGVWTYEVEDIPKETVEAVDSDVICYGATDEDSSHTVAVADAVASLSADSAKPSASSVPRKESAATHPTLLMRIKALFARLVEKP